jgi:hypothetical protein
MSQYLHGTDVLGAGMIPLAQTNTPQPALVIQVKNAGELVSKQGGKPGAFAFDAVPATLTNLIYGTMRSEFEKKLKEQGVDADVRVVAAAPTGPAPRSDFFPGVIVGAALTGIACGAWKLFRGLTR